MTYKGFNPFQSPPILKEPNKASTRFCSSRFHVLLSFRAGLASSSHQTRRTTSTRACTRRPRPAPSGPHLCTSPARVVTSVPRVHLVIDRHQFASPVFLCRALSSRCARCPRILVHRVRLASLRLRFHSSRGAGDRLRSPAVEPPTIDESPP